MHTSYQLFLILLGGVDYVLNTTDLIFPVGSQQGTRVCTDVDIIDDEVVEINYVCVHETFYVNLTTNDPDVQIPSFGQQRRVDIIDTDGETRKKNKKKQTKNSVYNLE